MRVLIISVPSTGHVRSMAPVAALLTARGHQIHWAANRSVAYVDRTGATLHSVLPDEWSEDGLAFDGALPDEIDLWFLEHWFVPIAERALAPTLDLARALAPDLLVVDSTALWGPIVADAISVPWVSYSPGLFLGSQARQIAIERLQHPEQPLDWVAADPRTGTHWAMERRLNALRRSVGLPADLNLNRVSDRLLLCFTTTQIELGGIGLPEQARCVGLVFGASADVDPFAGRLARLPDGDEPCAFVTLGRVQSRLTGFLEPILEALVALGMRAFVAAPGLPARFDDDERIVIADEPISQATLLDHVDVVVGPGGFNTVHEALAHGVPVVSLPVAGDEPALARRIGELGLGVTLPTAARSTDDIRDAIARVLSDETYRRRVRAFAMEVRLSDGVSRSVRLLERLHREGTVERSEEERVLEQLPSRPRVARRFTLDERTAGLAVTSYTEDLAIDDPASARAVRWLWRAVDGNTTTTGLIERWEGDVSLLPILSGLMRYGVLEDNVGDQALGDDTSDRYEEQITLFSHADGGGAAPLGAVGGQRYQERLLAARVTVLGAGVLGSNVVRGLTQCGLGGLVLLDDGTVDAPLVARGGWFVDDDIGASRTEALASRATRTRSDLEVMTSSLPDTTTGAGTTTSALGDPHLVIVATDTFDPDLYAWVDEVCQDRRQQWTSVRRNRMLVELGPTVIPGQSACFHCYELRRAANVPPETGLGRTGSGWFHLALGAEWIVVEAMKLLTGFGETATVGRVVAFDPLALSVARHRVLRVPTCTRCMVDPHAPPRIPWRTRT